MQRLKSWLYEAPPTGTGFWCSLTRALFGGLLLLKLAEGFRPAVIKNDPASIVPLILCYALALCLTVGVLSRTVTLIWAVICLASFHIQQFDLPNLLRLPLVGPGTYGFPTNLYFIGVVLLFLGFTPCGDYFSLFGAANKKPQAKPLWAVQIIRYQICAMYLWSATGKLISSTFTSGQTLELAWIYSVVGSLGYFHGAESARLWHGLALAVVAAELSLAVLLFVPRLRKAGIVFGIAFHFGAILLFPVTNFTLAVTAAYLMFLDPPRNAPGSY